ncbi:hypothetical protein FRB91_002521, partial [Serendipita sp. 411]
MPTLSGVVGRSLGGSAQPAESSSPFIIFPLERNVRVSQFPVPPPNPLESYRPLYTTLEDGSLITSVYKADLFSANSRLFGVGALLTLGAVNVWTCVSYIRRGKVKDKTLFYLLLASQVLLPICFSALLSPFFLSNVDCTIVNIVAVITTELSYAILITGILGLKAYRCLSKSRFILVVVWILQIGIFVLFALDIRKIDSPRRISGSCSTSGTVKFIPVALSLTVLETAFLAFCFAYAVWKSSLYPAAQGRLSIAISEKPPTGMEAEPSIFGQNPNPGTIRQRGWWDYVPRAPPSDAGSIRQGATGQTDGAGRPSDDSLVKRLRNSVMRLTTSLDINTAGAGPQPTYTRKPSIPTEQPLSQPPRLPQNYKQTSQAILNPNEKSRYSNGGPRHSTNSARSEVSPSARTTSVKSINFAASISGMTDRSSRIDPLQPIPPRTDEQESGQTPLWTEPSKRLPAVLQLRAVIKDEMIYTFVIVLSCVLSAGLSFYRARQNDVVFGPSVWLGANWAAISLLVMLTFSRVVRRHERDAILQSPSAFGGLFAANTALARRRRDALAFTRTASIVHSTASESGATRRRRLQRRSSWDYALTDGRIYAASLFDDNASLRRQEGLRAWEEEKAQRRMKELQNENPFADFHDIAGFGGYEEYDEEEEYGGRKSGEGPLGVEELMLDTDSIDRRGYSLQKPMIASPWTESPFTYVDGPGSTGSADVTPNGLRPHALNPFTRPSPTSPFDSGATLTNRRGSDIAVPEKALWNGEDHERPQFLQPTSN